MLIVILLVAIAVGVVIQLIGTGTIMAQQDDLKAILDSIGASVDEVATDVTTLKQTIADLQNATPPEVDLSELLDQATAIETKLKGVADSVPAPAPAPTEPTPPTA